MAAAEENNALDEDKKVSGGEPATSSATSALLNTFLNKLTTTVSENQQDATLNLERMDEVMSQLGSPPDSAPPYLWLGYMEHSSDLKDITNSLKRKADVSSIPSVDGITNQIEGIEQQFQELYRKLESAFHNIESQLQSTLAHATKLSGGGSSTNHTSKAELDLVIKQVQDLSTLICTLQNIDQNRMKAVRIGKYVFQTMDDLEAWMSLHLPTNFPFGAFVDVYSFLQRLKSNRDIVESERSIVAGMEDRRKSKLTVDMSLVVESFAYPLPRCFNGLSSTDAANWLPGLKSKQK